MTEIEKGRATLVYDAESESCSVMTTADAPRI